MLLLNTLLLLCQGSYSNSNPQSEQIPAIEASAVSPLSGNEPQSTSKDPNEYVRKDLEAQESMAFFAKWTFYISVVSAIVSAAGLVAIVYSLRLNDDATIAAQQAVAEAKRGNDIQNRAWLSISCSIEDPHDGQTHQSRIDGLYLNVVCSIKNHGNAPALGVRFNAEADVVGQHRPDVLEWLNEFAAKWLNAPVDGSSTVFPDDTIVLSHYVFLPHDVLLGAASTNNIGAVCPAVIGCVSYSYPTSHSRAQTRFHLSLGAQSTKGNAEAIVPTQEGKLIGVIGVCQPVATYAD